MTNAQRSAEYDEQSTNNMNMIKIIGVENKMNEERFNGAETIIQGIKVVFHFPDYSEQDETIKTDVKTILSATLKEQLENDDNAQKGE